jgi:predicted ribosome quality control (RQC) complex YloA/Tae2 family protein
MAPVPPFQPGIQGPIQASIQAMDATSLKAVLAELRGVVLPSRFEKAQQPDGQTAQVGLRGLTGSHWLELSWLAEAPRLLAIDPPPRQGEGSTLARQLQHSLRGLALVAIEQSGWERVVELSFARRPGEAPQRALVLELMGRHSNLFLLDAERRVIALGRQVRQQQSRLRPIGTGDVYRPPPPPGGDSPRLEEEAASWQRRLTLLPQPLQQALVECYVGISPALARQLSVGIESCSSCPPLLQRPVQELEASDWRQLWQRWQQWLEAVAAERFQLAWGGPSDYRCWGGPTRPEAKEEPATLAINRGLAAYYHEHLARRRLEQRRQALDQRLRSACAREARGTSLQQELLAAVPAAEELQRRADGLLCRSAPSREEIDEAQKLYRQARKLRRSVAAITPRLERHQQRLEALEASLVFLEQAETPEQLEALEEELQELLGPRQGGSPPGPARPPGRRRTPEGGPPPRPLELLTASGLRLQVGRNHRQNEWISLRQARRGDLWFHAQECPGSHVVLKGSERTPAEADLVAAADLAAHFSRGHGNARVPVVMVPTDDLQRLPGAAAGTVRHRGGVILWGEPERARALLERP